MTNLGTSPAASMSEKTDRCRYHDRKEADESGECDARLSADHEPHDKQRCERNFWNN
jgi:hypothetical protein